jgi:hypothetical protein
MSAILSTVNENLEKVRNHPSFRAWHNTQKFEDGDLVVINNSFVFRDLNTTKAQSYLVLKHGKERFYKEPYIAQKLKLNSDFTFYSHRHSSPPALLPIRDCIEDELSNVGQILFALIGTISDDVILRENFGRSGFSELIWDPQSAETLCIDGSRIVIQNPYDEGLLWNVLTEQCNAKSITLEQVETKRDFGAVLDRLQGRAEAHLVLPKSGRRNNHGITDTIIEALRERRQDYAAALRLCEGKPEKNPTAFNEVLRISYNFSNDVIPFLKLIISICDIKPIVLWSTIGEHYALSESLKCLPWTRSKFKPSLKNYIDTVCDARNSVFHNLFPVSKALRFSLPGNAFQNSELLFFTEYAPRKSLNTLTYQDKALVDLFLDFTRARQRPVPSEFWMKNADVMDKIINLIDATNRALKELYVICSQGAL